jgi:hypothetical protein
MRRVLVSHKLPTLQSGTPELDRWVEQNLQPFVSNVFDQLSYLTPEEAAFTPTIRGSGTAGTYELASNLSRYYRSGDLVYITVWVQLEAVITAGGTNDLLIAGLPFEKIEEMAPYGAVVFSGVNWTAGANLAVGFSGNSLNVIETNDNAAVGTVPVSGLAANDVIAATIAYVTNGVRA